ncbi:MAG: hypothetical protein KDE14_12240 [Rhodobacteraceae bacterium]|nr:hypothetical protein [Paracoccaceae bacterium]
MSDHIVLLTAPEFAAVAVGPLRAEREDLTVTAAYTAQTVHELLNQHVGRNRLIGFATGVIVPPDLLRRFDAGAYNFHGGPPTYPGVFPSVFAIYDGATKFGATLHEMSNDVDTGAIVATESFDLPPTADRLTVDTLALQAMLNLLSRMAPQLVRLDRRLRLNGENWSGPVRRQRDFSALCHLPDDVSRTEFDRRYRAVGEGPNHALELSVHGHRFKLDNRRDNPIVRASAPVRRSA